MLQKSIEMTGCENAVLQKKGNTPSRTRLFCFLFYIYMGVYISISSVVEFQRWWVLKSKVFGQESTYSKEIVVFYEYNELWFVKKCQNHTFNVDFLCQKSMELFWIFFSLMNINLGDHFLLKSFYLRSMLILGLKSYFLGPTMFEIPQPNWY